MVPPPLKRFPGGGSSGVNPWAGVGAIGRSAFGPNAIGPRPLRDHGPTSSRVAVVASRYCIATISKMVPRGTS